MEGGQGAAVEWTRPVSAAFSQTGRIAVTCAKSVEIYESSKKLKAFQPYLSHKLDGSHATNSVFRPFEDVLLVGHALGVDSILVPGSGEASYDAIDGDDPYRSKKGPEDGRGKGSARQITHRDDHAAGAGFVGTVERDAAAADKERRALEEDANAALSKRIKEKKEDARRVEAQGQTEKAHEECGVQGDAIIEGEARRS